MNTTDLIYFRHWMFYQSRGRSSEVSPAAVFCPTRVSAGNPMQSSTRPSQKLVLKDIVLTNQIFTHGLGQHHWLAIISWLHSYGFTVYACLNCQDGSSPRFQLISSEMQGENIAHTMEILSNLDQFIDLKDYQELADQYGLVRDKTTVLDSDKILDWSSDLKYGNWLGCLSSKLYINPKRNILLVYKNVIDELGVLDSKKIALLQKLQNLPSDKITDTIRSQQSIIDTVEFLSLLIEIFPEHTLLFGELYCGEELRDLRNFIALRNFLISDLVIQKSRLIQKNLSLFLDPKFSSIKSSELSIDIFDRALALLHHYNHHDISVRLMQLHAEAHDIAEIESLIKEEDSMPHISVPYMIVYHDVIIKHPEKQRVLKATDIRILLSSKNINEKQYLLESYLNRVILPSVKEDSSSEYKYMIEALKHEIKIATGQIDLIPQYARQVQYKSGGDFIRFMMVLADIRPEYTEFIHEVLFANSSYSTDTQTTATNLEYMYSRFPTPLNLHVLDAISRKTMLSTMHHSAKLLDKRTTYLYLYSKEILPYISEMLDRGILTHIKVIEVADTLRMSDKLADDELLAIIDFIADNYQRLSNKQNLFLILPNTIIGKHGLDTHPDITIKYLEAAPPIHVGFSSSQSHLRPALIKDSIYIAPSGVPTDSDPSEKQIVSVGKYLNDDLPTSLPRIRCGLFNIKHGAQFELVAQSEQTSKKDIKVKSLTAEELSKFSKDKKAIYGYFITKLPAGKIIRLNSFDPTDLLEGVIDTDLDNISITRGVDDFYYAKAIETCEIQYVVSVKRDKPEHKLTSELIKSDVDEQIKKIIIDYLHHPKFKHIGNASKVLPIVDGNLDAWYHYLYAERAGVCRHRVVAVYHKIVTVHPDLANRVRIVNISNDHVRLEVHDIKNSKWLQVDLGGSISKIRNVHNDNISKLTKLLKKQHISKTTDDTDAHMASKLVKIITENPVPLKTAAELMQIIQTQKHRKILIRAEKIDDIANSMIQQLVQKFNALFYIDNKSKISFLDQDIEQNREYIYLHDDGIPYKSKQNELEMFLAQTSLDLMTQATIIINWTVLTAQERLKLNTVLDKKQSISGISIPDHIKIIGLINGAIHDDSFVSRHNLYVTLPDIKPNISAGAVLEPEQIVVDLAGRINWEEILFGKIEIKDNQLFWQPSPLVVRLKVGTPIKLVIINAADELKDQIKYYLNQSKSLGSFYYNGIHFKIPAGFDTTISAANFDFTQFVTPSHDITLYTEITLERFTGISVPKVINTEYFEELLSRNHILDTVYNQQTGLIEQQRDGKLALFITGDITVAQWYCMLYQAKIHQLKLDLYLAPSIKPPEELVTCIQEHETPSTLRITEDIEKRSRIKVTITNNDRELIRQRYGKHIYPNVGESLLISVEDYNYQELFEKITFKSTETSFTDFHYVESELLHALRKGRNVILYGVFSDYMISCIHPVLAGQFDMGLGSLEIIMQDNALNAQQVESKIVPESLRWLPDSMITMAFVADSKKDQSNIIFDETNLAKVLGNIETSSELKAQRFIDLRLITINTTLAKHQMVQLVGKSGVGKTSIVHELAQTKGYKAYYELSSLEDWANDQSDVNKILFIDETNIEDQHLTIFEPLKEGGNHIILYHGKLFKLSLQHKVIFAHNPIEFGGGRLQQKLFDDHSIPTLIFDDFPDYYMYEKIMKAVYMKSNCSKILSEETFKQDCFNYISSYKKRCNSLGHPELTAREHQQWAINYCTRMRLHHSYFSTRSLAQLVSKFRFAKTGYVKTDYSIEARMALHVFINLHKNWYGLETDSGLKELSGFGLNGFLIDGAPGVGKSELIAATLRAANYKIVNVKPEELGSHEPAESSIRICYKIDASMSILEKRMLILKAFQYGHAVWIDEINSCIDDGLEKVLNAALTGINFETHLPAAREGFMLLASTNSFGLEGRSKISPAFLHRLIQINLGKPAQLDFAKILNEKLTGEQKASIGDKMDDFCEQIAVACKKIDACNMRQIENKLEQLVKEYTVSQARAIALARSFT